MAESTSGPEIETRMFPRAEFDERLRRVQESMAAEGMGALVLTSQDNVVYLTGFDSPTWVNLARPRYCVVPAVGEIVFIVPTTNVAAVERLTWVRDIRSWVSPNPADDGLSLVAEAVLGCAPPETVLGFEIGPQSRLGLPVSDYLKLCGLLAPRRIVDADGLLREVRKIKSAAEVAAIRHAAAGASRAFARLRGAFGPAETERSAVQRLRGALHAEGIDDVPYLVAESEFGGYPSLQMAPTGRVLREGSILGIDVGCRWNGYYADFNRNFAFGRAPDIVERVDDALWLAVEDGIAATVPRASASDIWHAMARRLDQALAGLPAQRAASGRMGHAIGLRLTEPPSIHPDDQTVLAPGMVLAIEPSVVYEVDTPDGRVKRMLIHEENVVVTERGAELLSVRAPRSLTGGR